MVQVFKRWQWRTTNLRLPENTAHLDHVEFVVVEENGIHFAVQLFESALDGVGGQRAIGANLEEEMVA